MKLEKLLTGKKCGNSEDLQMTGNIISVRNKWSVLQKSLDVVLAIVAK
jgi:hypothetical protein